jgi:hypothetical protein
MPYASRAGQAGKLPLVILNIITRDFGIWGKGVHTSEWSEESARGQASFELEEGRYAHRYYYSTKARRTAAAA